jgi:hypothetical protein
VLNMEVEGGCGLCVQMGKGGMRLECVGKLLIKGDNSQSEKAVGNSTWRAGLIFCALNSWVVPSLINP